MHKLCQKSGYETVTTSGCVYNVLSLHGIDLDELLNYVSLLINTISETLLRTENRDWRGVQLSSGARGQRPGGHAHGHSCLRYASAAWAARAASLSSSNAASGRSGVANALAEKSEVEADEVIGSSSSTIFVIGGSAPRRRR